MSLEKIKQQNRERIKEWLDGENSGGNYVKYDKALRNVCLDGYFDLEDLDQITTTSYQAGVKDAMEIVQKAYESYPYKDSDLDSFIEALTNQ